MTALALCPVSAVKRAVERVFPHLLPDMIWGTGRSADIVVPRIFAYRALRELGMSFPRIGAALKRDHSTIVHGLRRFDYYRQAHRIQTDLTLQVIKNYAIAEISEQQRAFGGGA